MIVQVRRLSHFIALSFILTLAGCGGEGEGSVKMPPPKGIPPSPGAPSENGVAARPKGAISDENFAKTPQGRRRALRSQ
jgi:hypothetical protein